MSNGVQILGEKEAASSFVCLIQFIGCGRWRNLLYRRRIVVTFPISHLFSLSVLGLDPA